MIHLESSTGAGSGLAINTLPSSAIFDQSLTGHLQRLIHQSVYSGNFVTMDFSSVLPFSDQSRCLM